MQVLIEPLLREASIRSIKPMSYAPSYSPAHGELKYFCFVPVAPKVCASRVFIYDVVDINKLLSFLHLNAFTLVCTSEYMAKAIPCQICQFMVNILSQNPNSVDESYGCQCSLSV